MTKINVFKVNKFTVLHCKHPSDLISAKILINVGSENENPGDYGLAHFLEHMMFKGTLHRDYQTINRISSKLGNINAYTGHRETGYTFKFLSKNFQQAMDLLLELVFEPALPIEEIEKEKTVILEEYQSNQDDGDSYFFTESNKKLIGEDIGHNILGTPDQIKAVNQEKLKNFISNFYHPNNMIVIIVGNIGKKDVKEYLKQKLPKIKTKLLYEHVLPNLNFDRAEIKHKTEQAHFSLFTNGISSKEEIQKNYISYVFCSALGAGMHSLLFQRLREELGLCYSVYMWHNSFLKHGHTTLWTKLNKSNLDLCEQEIRKILHQVTEHGFEDELLDVAKENTLFQHAASIESSIGISSVLSRYFEIDGSSIQDAVDFNNFQNKIESLTNNDMIEFARYLFSDEKQMKILTMTQE